jgi:hypothetical protein
LFSFLFPKYNTSCYEKQPVHGPKSPWQPIVNGLHDPAAVVVVVVAAVVVVVPAVVVVVPAVVVVVPDVVVVGAAVVVVPEVVVVGAAVVVVTLQFNEGMLGVPIYVPDCWLVIVPPH